MHDPLDARTDPAGTDSSRMLGQRLRDLPAERAPPFEWAELERRTLARRAHPRGAQRRRSTPGRALLLAAALASVVAAVLLADRLIRGAGAPSNRGPDESGTLARAPTSGEAPSTRAGRDPERLLRSAAAAERWLASQPDDEPIVRVSTHLAVTELEDRIASVDDLLNVERMRRAHARVHALQLERAQLVDSLAQVRYAEILTTDPP